MRDGGGAGAVLGAVVGYVAHRKAAAEGAAADVTIAGLLVLGSTFGGVTGVVIHKLRSLRSG
ncbi:MAG: hypothetical protein ACLFRX_09325, partial [Gemmatimonadota bacterium]